jgi:hypothetical protein
MHRALCVSRIVTYFLPVAAYLASTFSTSGYSKTFALGAQTKSQCAYRWKYCVCTILSAGAWANSFSTSVGSAR